MKKSLLLLLFSFAPAMAFSQFGVEFVVSNLPQLGVNYEFRDRIRAGVNIGTDTYLEDIAIEVIGTYDLLDNEEYEVYAGIGGRFNNYRGFVIPIGMNIYPFVTDRFGFKIEIAPILGDENILRGGAGFRYRISGGK